MTNERCPKARNAVKPSGAGFGATYIAADKIDSATMIVEKRRVLRTNQVRSSLGGTAREAQSLSTRAHIDSMESRVSWAVTRPSRGRESRRTECVRLDSLESDATEARRGEFYSAMR